MTDEQTTGDGGRKTVTRPLAGVWTRGASPAVPTADSVPRVSTASTLRLPSSIFRLLLGLALTACTSLEPTPVDAVVAPPSASWVSVYFTTPQTTAELEDAQGGVPALLIDAIGTARQRVDVAIYDMDLQPIAEALVAARARGVFVRVVTDSDYLGEPAMQTVINAGIPVVDDVREPFMHHKFVVIDAAEVWAGSMNFTYSDAYRNDNVMFQLRSVRLAENYTAEFEQLFTRRTFEQAGQPPNPQLTVSGTLVENYFSPRAGVADRIAAVLASAQHSIRFLAFSFTRSDLTDILLERAAAGVRVQGVFERRQISAGADAAWLALSTAGLPTLEVRQDGNRYTLHTKAFIVDEAIVIAGSYNFSRNAEEQNNENVLILHAPEVAAAFTAEWQRIWAAAGR